MISVTIKHGLESITKQLDDGSTVGDILGNSGILSALSASEASQTLINGSSVNSATGLRDGDTVVLERQAASKA